LAASDAAQMEWAIAFALVVGGGVAAMDLTFVVLQQLFPYCQREGTRRFVVGVDLEIALWVAARWLDVVSRKSQSLLLG